MKTKILVDNTTIASAGRSLHFGDANEGGNHAAAFYQKYPQIRYEDINSLAELLTTLILFDEIYWDGSSFVQESKETNLEGFNNAWVYKWFPAFEQIKEIIIPFDDWSETRLQYARILTMQWVKTKLLEQKISLPTQFRVPIVYFSKDHFDRNEFEKINSEYQFDESHLATAMFLHRGLYYQSLIYTRENFSYSPHSYRSCLMNNFDFKLLSQVCFQAPSVHILDGKKIMNDVDETLIKNLSEAVNIDNIPPGLGIGFSFFQSELSNPKKAFELAMEFRNSKYGIEIRSSFKNLIELGRFSNMQAVKDRIGDINKQISDYRKHLFGTSGVKDTFIEQLISDAPFQIGGWLKLFIEECVPRKYYEALTKLVNNPIQPTGYQLIFKNYLPKV